ncbi:hypothetical protein [Filibacter tadaridae]|nr:hypothetical protein [Filibacter tadaridae]
MQKPTKKSHTILLGAIIILVIIFMSSGIGGKEKKEDDVQQYAELEQALMKIDGIGKVTLYFHYENEETANSLSNYFSTSSSSTKEKNPLRGLLVVAEGAGEYGVRSKLLKILSAVLQLPEHRIVIQEMEKRGNSNEDE